MYRTRRISSPHRARAATRLSTGAALLLVLLAGCKEIVAPRLPDGTPALHRAAARDDVAGVRRHLGKDVNRRGPHGWTALHYAAIHNARGTARALMERRANVDALDQTGMTPLHWAARRGNHHMVELLLERKAEVMARNQYDMTPLHEASTVAVARLLLAAGADKEARNVDGMTPLHTAPTKVVAQFLIKQGANMNARAKDGRTPMDMPPVPAPRVER